MTVNFEPSILDPPNPGQVFDSDDETEATEKNLEDYYESKIEHNHPNFHMIRKIFKEEHKYLRSRIDLFNN